MQKYQTRRIAISGKDIKLNALIADSPIKQAVGLMYRRGLKENECMLFIFGRASRYGIWMHNMLFPIDIIWLDEKRKVTDLVENAEPCHSLFCPTYKPKSPSMYVVETKSGFVAKHSIKIGMAFNLH